MFASNDDIGPGNFSRELNAKMAAITCEDDDDDTCVIGEPISNGDALSSGDTSVSMIIVNL